VEKHVLDQLTANLEKFMGSEKCYRTHHNVLITEGVKYLCDTAQCFWLIDCISSYQRIHKVADEPFQVVELNVDLEKCTGIIVVTDGNNNEVFRQLLDYTNFPLKQIKLYYTDCVVMLPREY
jgi:hypothetical protein